MENTKIKLGRVKLETNEIFFTIKGLPCKLFLDFNQWCNPMSEEYKIVTKIKEEIAKLKRDTLTLTENTEPLFLVVEYDKVYIQYIHRDTKENYYSIPLKQLNCLIKLEVTNLFNDIDLLVSNLFNAKEISEEVVEETSKENKE